MSAGNRRPLILCMKWGTRYGREYVNRLFRMASRNLTGPFDFICFTDDPTGLDAGIDARPLPAFDGVPKSLSEKPWRKLSLWRKDLGADLTGRNALVLDVDLLVTGPLDAFFTFEPDCPFVVWRNPTKPTSGVGNTSIFRLQVGFQPELCDRFVANPEKVAFEEFRIEQEVISARLGDGTATRVTGLTPAVKADSFYRGLNVMRYWPDGWCASFKEDLLPSWPMRLWQQVRLPPDASVVVFHGKPDPDEAVLGQWPEKVWWKRIYKRIRPVTWIAEIWN